MKKKEQGKKVAVITGASSGIGLATAKMLKSHGVVVYGMAYNDFEAEFNYIKCDVTNVEQIESSIKEIFEKEGRIDYLVNCAGMGISGSVENSPNDKIKKIFDVNAFGDKFRRKLPKKILGKEVQEVLNIDGIKLIFADDSWLLARPSGTEPIIRLYAETPDKKQTQALLEIAEKALDTLK